MNPHTVGDNQRLFAGVFEDELALAVGVLLNVAVVDRFLSERNLSSVGVGLLGKRKRRCQNNGSGGEKVLHFEFKFCC